MIGMGFYARWVEMTMRCVESVGLLVLINGVHGPYFKPYRGLRQGDPLSPYLFLLCSKDFFTLLSREEKENNFTGFRINKYFLQYHIYVLQMTV